MQKWLRKVAALCFVLLLGAGMFLSGTFAWESNQKARNDIYGTGTEKIPVVLVKQEKSTDGTITGVVIPNTAFYLFWEDGTQIGGRYLTNENGEIHVELNPGSYYFEEITPAIGYTYDLDENGEPITRYPFEVTSTDTLVYVYADNIPLTGDLLIRKTVENEDGSALSAFQLDTEFTFTVTFSDGGSYAYSVDGVPMGLLVSGKTLTLKHGQTASFDTLPHGLLYNVTEQTPVGYAVSGTGHRGNITEEQSVAEFVNRIDMDNTGALVISKRVEGAGANLEREFRFSLTIGDATESFVLKDGESKTFAGLPIGTAYTVTEDDYSAYGYYAEVQSYSGTIANTEAVELSFVNHYLPEPGSETGSLTVTKDVWAIDAAPDTEFVFTITFTGENAPESQTFTLKDGESKTFWDIPLGTKYVVREETENLPDGYYATVQEYSGTVATAENVVLSFVNGYNTEPEEKLGRLIVAKNVVGENADPEQTFEFFISFFGENAPESTSFTLCAGETIEFYAPHGVLYVVEELNSGDYEAVVQKASGSFVGEVVATVTFTNVAPDTEEDPTTGELIIRKVVSGEQADPDTMFAFSVEFYGEGAPDGGTFLLKNGMYMRYDNIPQGVRYKVTETDPAGLTPTIEIAEGTITAGETVEVTFTNVEPGEEPPTETIRLTVRKDLAGLETDPDKAFTMTLVAGDMTETFTLKGGETKEFSLPKGTVYELWEENYISEGYRQYITNGTGTASTDILIVVTNTHVAEEVIEIPGTKTWELCGCENAPLPESITVRLLNGELLVEEQIVEPDDEGVWSYLFTAPKYNTDGTEAEYTVQELPVPGFKTSYDGYDILNTYVPPISVDFPIITKLVEGEDIPTTEFWFGLRGLPGAPMPDGTDGYFAWSNIVGAGQASFGEITFTEPGEYTYLVFETDDRVLGWTYDAAIYTVVFTVTEDETGLSCEYKIYRNYNLADEIVFVNSYEEVDLTETVIIRGEKIWNHGDNPAENRPDHVIVLIYANGRLVQEIVVTENDDWEYSIELPKYDAYGAEIVYTVDEVEVEGYTKIVNGYILINTYESDDPEQPDDPIDPDDPDDPTPDDPDDPVPDDPDDPTPDTPDVPTPDIPDKPDIPDDVPKTGDESNLPMWYGLMALSLIGIIATILIGRKPRYKGKHLKRR